MVIFLNPDSCTDSEEEFSNAGNLSSSRQKDAKQKVETENIHAENGIVPLPEVTAENKKNE